MKALRDVATDLFLRTMEKISVPAKLRSHVTCADSILRVDGCRYELGQFRRVVIVGMGKAVEPMFETIRALVEPELKADQTMEGVLVGPHLERIEDARFVYLSGSHPFPDERSEEAADAILELLGGCDESCLVLFLISGGASAMVERPLGSMLTTEDMVEFHRALVASGLRITEMNILRKHISAVKGGRLAVAAGGATQCSLLLSDIPGEALHVVGSGPSLPDPSTSADCRRLVEANLEALRLPDRLLDFLRNPQLPETPKADNVAFAKARWFSLLSSDDMSRAAAELATELGFEVIVDNSCDEWDYREAAAYLVGRIEALHAQHPRICVISVGEVSVRLREEHGTGGRNQQFALECARLIAERKLTITVVSGGSDGIDGNSTAAGAVCDETTFERAREHGMDGPMHLRTFDSFPLFQAIGDAIITGPTGNNVRDLRLLLIWD